MNGERGELGQLLHHQHLFAAIWGFSYGSSFALRLA